MSLLAQDSYRGSFRQLAGACVGFAVAAGLSIAHVPLSHATDVASIETNGGNRQDGRFLRIGLSKSAVLKLPAEAKDIIVGDTTIVDVVLRKKNTAYLFARKAGQTNVFFFDADGREILQLDLEVALDSRGLKRLLDRSMPGNAITVDTSGSNIVLKGTVSNAQSAKQAVELATQFVGGQTEDAGSSVVNLLKIAQLDQVMLKVRVVELKRTVLKELGVDIDAKLGVVTFGNTPTGLLGNVMKAGVELASGGNSVEATIKALEEQGLATTLAEPTLTAVSGAPASFLAGGEQPYEVCDNSINVNSCSVTFKPYGVSLEFTPTVLDENRIALNIATEVSEIVDRLSRVPSIDTRRAQTSVEIPSGSSMMMAGLIKDVSLQKLKGTPGLRTLPVLGALFSSRDYLTNQSELVVIVTPYIARPTGPGNLATPVDKFNLPTDLQQIFLGRLNRVYGASGERPVGVYHGAVGHIVD